MPGATGSVLRPRVLRRDHSYGVGVPNPWHPLYLEYWWGSPEAPASPTHFDVPFSIGQTAIPIAGRTRYDDGRSSYQPGKAL